MKKIFLLISVFSIFLMNLFAQNYANEKVVIAPSVEGLSEEEASSVKVFVKDRLQYNLGKYSELEFVNNTNIDEIIELQKESESGLYDENTTIEIGKLANSRYAIFVTIGKANDRYFISAKFTDLQEMIDIGTTPPVTRGSVEELADTYGCAVDELTKYLLESMGIPLTKMDEMALMLGDSALTDSEKIIKFKEDGERYKQQIADMTREINVLAASTDVEAQAQQDKLKREKEVLERQLEWKETRRKRLEEEAERRRNAEKENMERDESIRIRLKETSAALQTKLASIRSVRKESFISKIRYVESKKKSFTIVQEDCDAKCDVIREDAQFAIDIKKEEIKNRPLEIYEKSGGKITYTAQANRDKELEKFARDTNESARKRISFIEKNCEMEQASILKEIEKAYKTFEKVTITTRGEELIVDFGEYDGRKNGWPLTITVQSDDIVILQTKAFLPFKLVAGYEAAPDVFDANHDQYNADVEYYSVLFSINEPLLTFALDIVIEPAPKDRPSEYSFAFEDFRFYDTLKLNSSSKMLPAIPKDRVSLRNSYINHRFSPSYDIRTKSDFAAEERAIQEANEIETRERMEQERRVRERKQKEREKRQKEETKKEAIANREFDRDMFALTYSIMPFALRNSAAGLEISKGLCSFIYFDYKFDLFNMMNLPPMYYPVAMTKFNPMISNMFSLGINMHFGQKFQIYGSAGLGANVSFPSSIFSEIKNDIEDPMEYLRRTCKADFTWGWDAGLSLEIVRHLVMTANYGQTYLFGKNYMYDRVQVGLGYMF